MKIKTSLIVILFFSFVSALSAQMPATETKELILEKGVAPHAKIDDVYRRFSEAYKKLDAEAVTNLYTDDALAISPGNDIERGREKILENFSNLFNPVKTGGGSLTISFRILERRVSGNLAYDVGIFTFTRKSAKGEARSGRGKFVVVVRRMKNGEWRFQVDAYNDLPAAQSNQAAASNPKDLETLLEQIFAERMEKLYIPGAVVAVVKDGKIIFTKGYGVADVDRNIILWKVGKEQK
ncbi:MAG: SgcJ/EcaC family oxidoreductase [Acidobacteria bacterium]|nr:SgcJ/EcaC family oxidoreductase [Acidobacteriota bacterium]